MKSLIVTAAIIINNNQILCMQRGEGKYDYIANKFEFPGGKLDDGETYEEGLARELMEEMDITVDVKPEDYFMTLEHSYPDFHITLRSYICHVDSREFKLKEHISFKWLDIKDLKTVEWPAADYPIIDKLQEGAAF
ncbi:MAG: (deoxy)nucleoside triphosphate pyrophosphohydrolase [Bacillota bacterium]|nr:(deoxy)nucleoside triphosphate pyrophosphohydrolase [Bacillota bacterium]